MIEIIITFLIKLKLNNFLTTATTIIQNKNLQKRWSTKKHNLLLLIYWLILQQIGIIMTQYLLLYK